MWFILDSGMHFVVVEVMDLKAHTPWVRPVLRMGLIGLES